MSYFIGQAVALSREFVPNEWFAQTHCLELLTHLNKFLRQRVTILGKLGPQKRFSQTSRIIPLIEISLL